MIACEMLSKRLPVYVGILLGVLSLCFATGCGSSPITPASMGNIGIAPPNAAPGDFKLLYSFSGNPNGAFPEGTLARLNGTLYGVTETGGISNYGTIYSLRITGKEKVIHSFDASDGESPVGSLLAYNGILYGTVAAGTGFYGGVYSITPSGNFKLLYKFTGLAGPKAGLVQTGGLLYGTTFQGGRQDEGSVYDITPSGTANTLYSFGARSGDGTYPASRLTVWKNTLYGTTNEGGTHNRGTVFSLTKSGTETVLHSFRGGTDGDSPGFSTVIPLDGVLYGTTYEGGRHGMGIVFEVPSSGKERTLYNFGDAKTDGAYPNAGVVAYHGALYGTTSSGGASNQGTIFRVTPNGKETTLYSMSGVDGSESNGCLLLDGTDMYGTANQGGAYNGGTAFRFAQ
jgi:uncharacterized repeat protein (TIGR03803 family)